MARRRVPCPAGENCRGDGTKSHSAEMCAACRRSVTAAVSVDEDLASGLQGSQQLLESIRSEAPDIEKRVKGLLHMMAHIERLAKEGHATSADLATHARCSCKVVDLFETRRHEVKNETDAERVLRYFLSRNPEDLGIPVEGQPGYTITD